MANTVLLEFAQFELLQIIKEFLLSIFELIKDRKLRMMPTSSEIKVFLKKNKLFILIGATQLTFQVIYLILERVLVHLLFSMAQLHAKSKRQVHIFLIEAISVIVIKHQILEVICMEI